MYGLLSLRHPREWSDLAVAIAIATVFFILISVFTWGLCCLWGAFGLLISSLLIAVQNAHVRNVSRKVTEDGPPEIHTIVKEVAGRLRMRPPDVYISASPEVNAYTRGLFHPILVLNDGLVKAMDRGEVIFVLGHEMGHIRLRHFAIGALLGSSSVRVPLIVYFPLLLFRYLFLHGRLSRSMEYSADRAGLVACASLEKAVSTMIKLGTGRTVTYDQVKGAIEGRFRIDGDPGLVEGLLSTHPDLDDRVKELVRYSTSLGR